MNTAHLSGMKTDKDGNRVNVTDGKRGFQPVVNDIPANTELAPTPDRYDPDTGDDLTLMFHGTSAPEGALEKHGLLPQDGLSDEGMLGEGVTTAVFLTPDPEEAAEYGGRVLRVDISGMGYERIDGPDGYHYVVTDPAGISPDRFRDATDEDYEEFDLT